MKEVEVKVRVNNLDEVEQKLTEQGFVFSAVVEQNDIIFAPPEILDKYDQFVSGAKFFRIRRMGDKILFTLKIPQTGELDNIEREMQISDAEQAEDMLKYLGFKESARVNKKRKIAKHGHYEVSLDNVEGLGAYVEVEHIVDMEHDSMEAQEEIWNFLGGLGFSKKDEEKRGYDTLVYLKNKA